MLAANISHALFSLSGALAVCQFYLLFVGISLIVRHVSTASLPPTLSQSRERSI